MNHKEELTIVLSETDNIYSEFVNRGIDISENRKSISLIGAKVHNNKIGYARLKTSNQIIKVIVCPKIFEFDTDRFRDFIFYGLDLIRKHRGKSGLFKIDKNLLNIAQIKEKEKQELSFDKLLELRYEAAIDSIDFYFRKFNSRRKLKKRYISNSLEYEIDVINSVIDPIKSNIHQTKSFFRFDQSIAEIALMVLERFIRKNRSFVSQGIIVKANQLHGRIKRLFFIKRIKTTLNVFDDTRARKIFNTQKKTDLKDNFLTLLSSEDFFQSLSGSTATNEYVSSNSFFFEANALYELAVYEYLVTQYGEQFVSVKPVLTYSLLSDEGIEVTTLKSEPDFIVLQNKDAIAIDAKWKLLQSLDSQFSYDVLKLNRDCTIHKTDSAMLIYPKISKEINAHKSLYFEHDSKYKVQLNEVGI